MSCAITTQILEDKAFIVKYTRKSRHAMGDQYAFATKILDDAGIDYVRDGYDALDRTDTGFFSNTRGYRNAGFFLWVDLGPYLLSTTSDETGWKSEQTLASAISGAGVVMSSGLKYHAERPGWFRVIFTAEREALEEGLRRYVLVLQRAFS
jgi:1-aminocyclopropane-1-carboxylate synthase